MIQSNFGMPRNGRQPQFQRGQLVRHRRYGYRGVVVGLDLECLASAQRWMDIGLDQLILIPLSRNYDEIIEVFAP